MKLRFRFAALVALAVIAVSGAGLLLARAQSGASGTLLPTHVASDANPLAVNSGRLALRDGCVYLGDADQLVIWPKGYTLDGERIRDGSGRAVARLGDVVSLGGGEMPAGDDAWLLGHVLDPSVKPACHVDEYWIATGVADR